MEYDELVKKLYASFSSDELRRLNEVKSDVDWMPRSDNMCYVARGKEIRRQIGLSMSDRIIKRVREVAKDKNIPISKLIEYILEATL